MIFSRLRTVLLLGCVSFFLWQAEAGRAAELTYIQNLDLAVSAMEEGKHIQALGPLRAALTIDRNDPDGELALGTLYLHANNAPRARVEFQRALALSPNEPLGQWGIALADLEQGKRDPAVFAAFSPEIIPAAPVVAQYVRILNGDGIHVCQETKSVLPSEPDALRLETAAFAALRGADADRGVALMSALVARPDMKALNEDRAVSLLFLSLQPAQGGVSPLPDSAVTLPAPPRGSVPLSGAVAMTPPSGLPTGSVAMVTYSTPGGGGWTASTNNPPFTATWNTARFPNGVYSVHVVAYDAAQHPVSDTVRVVTLSNPDAPAASHELTDDERKEMHQRLLTLLTPRPSRKAAWSALCEQARLKGDERQALDDAEAVVAIDPLFQGASQVMRTLRSADADALGPVNWWRGATQEKIVALTFDDGPNPLPTRTPALLDALKASNVTATFFVVGARAEQNTPLLKRMADEGHELADHSYSHPNLTFLDTPAVERELCRTAVIIREATGKRPRFYRPPGGNFNRAVIGVAGSLGMAGAYWTSDGVKFETGPYPPSKLTQYVLATARPGAIILLHNAPDNTIKALPEIAAGLRARGYEMVTMSELARRCAGEAITTAPPGYNAN